METTQNFTGIPDLENGQEEQSLPNSAELPIIDRLFKLLDLRKTLNKSTDLKEFIDKGIMIFDIKESRSKNDLQEYPQSHSIHAINHLIINPIYGGANIKLVNKQHDQLQRDLIKIFSNYKIIYVEFDFHNEKMKSVINFNNNGFNQEIKKILDDLNINKNCPDCPKIRLIIDHLEQLANKVANWKRLKSLNIGDNHKDFSVFNVLNENGVCVVINVFNLIEGIKDLGELRNQYAAKLNDIVRAFANSPYKLITSEYNNLSDDRHDFEPKTWSDFKEIDLSLPIAKDYEEIMQLHFLNSKFSEIYQNIKVNQPQKLQDIAKLSQGMYLWNFEEFLIDYISGNKGFNYDDFVNKLNGFKINSIKSEIECLEILDQSVSFDDVGGLENIKHEITMLGNSLKNGNDTQVYKTYLFLGIPGTGKSMISKSLSTQLSTLTEKRWVGVRFNISALFDKYVGNSEKNLRKAVSVLDGISRSNDGRLVVWIDEVEKALTGNETHNSTNRIMGELLTIFQEKWMKNFVVVGTMNNVCMVRPEFKAKFHHKFFFDSPAIQTRKKIIQIMNSEFGFEFEDAFLNELADKTDKFVGREIEKLFSDIKKQFNDEKNLSLNAGIINQSEYEKAKPGPEIVLECLNNMSQSIQEFADQSGMNQIRHDCVNYISADSEIDVNSRYKLSKSRFRF